MTFEDLNNVIGTFHDFDIINVESDGTKLTLSIQCYWNEMNDPNNPYMVFHFVFDDCLLIECGYYYSLPQNDDSNEQTYQQLSTKDISELVKLELSANSFKVIDGVHNIYCNGVQETSKVEGGTIKLLFNSSNFSIYDSDLNKIDLEEYRITYNKWWDFVGA